MTDSASKISLNDKVEFTACSLILFLDKFGNELLEKIDFGEIQDFRDITEFAKDKACEYFNGNKSLK